MLILSIIVVILDLRTWRGCATMPNSSRNSTRSDLCHIGLRQATRRGCHSQSSSIPLLKMLSSSRLRGMPPGEEPTRWEAVLLRGVILRCAQDDTSCDRQTYPCKPYRSLPLSCLPSLRAILSLPTTFLSPQGDRKGPHPAPHPLPPLQ
jgi:hypothetical protein